MLITKPKGYPFPGEVCGTFVKPDDKTPMSNVASLMHPGMVHVFPTASLEYASMTKRDLFEAHVALLREQYGFI